MTQTAPKKLAVIVVPDGYADAWDFAKDCGFDLARDVNADDMSGYQCGYWSRRNFEAMLEDFHNAK